MKNKKKKTKKKRIIGIDTSVQKERIVLSIKSSLSFNRLC